ncbi:uncharacterized mitochondrial protein-like protein [Tanacetum coccineum]
MVKFIFHLLDLSWAQEFHQDRASSVKVQVANFALQSSVQLLWENIELVRSNQRIRASLSPVFLLLESWLVLQMLMSFWEAFYQHKTTRNKNDIRTWKKLLPNPWWLLMELALTEPIEDRMMKYFSPPKLDLSNSDLEEFQQREFEGYGPKTNKSVTEDISNEVRESPDALLVEELVSDDKLEKKTVFPTVAKIEFVRPKQQEKPVRKPVKYAEMYRENSLSSQTLKEFEWKDMLPLGEEPKEGKLLSGVQTRRMTKTTNEQGFISAVYEGKTHKDLHTCLFACFLSQEEPKRIAKALSDSAWVEAMQEELLQFKLQKVWILVDLPKGKRAIGTKWVFRNKKDERGIVIRNKARLVAQGHTQEEGIDYDEVFAPVARIEAIRLFLAYASFMGFMVYQMDVKSAFLYGRIEDEMSSMGELTFFLGLQVKQKEDGIFISQDKYVADILRKFSFIYVRTTSTLMDTEKPLLKDSDGDIDDRIEMFISTVTPKVLHLHAVKRIFSDYDGASLDRKSTTGGCQFLGCRLISWQCKKQTMVATSSTEAEYVAAASCCGQDKQSSMVGFVIPIMEFVRGKAAD